MCCGSREPDVQADRRPEADRRSEPPLGGGAPGGFLGGPTPDPGAPAERQPRVDESRSPHESCLRHSSGARTAARRFAVRHFSRLVREPRLAPPSAHSHDRMLVGQESRTGFLLVKSCMDAEWQKTRQSTRISYGLRTMTRAECSFRTRVRRESMLGAGFQATVSRKVGASYRGIGASSGWPPSALATWDAKTFASQVGPGAPRNSCIQ